MMYYCLFWYTISVVLGSFALKNGNLDNLDKNHIDKGISTVFTLTDLLVPPHVVRGQNARLECLYHLGRDNLYSVKWYKNGHEFFRFVPGEEPQVTVFLLEGVNVDLSRSNSNQVMLTEVRLETSGRYRCEVSGEAPLFPTVSESQDMTVVDLPADGPTIYGGKPRYQIGENVRVNCTSAKSIPAAKLIWFINGDPADEHFIHHYPISMDSMGLETSTVGLKFRVRHRHFKDGDLKLKCLATIATVYWKSNEESVVGDRPQRAPVLESRETVYPGKRAASSSSHRHSSNLVWLMFFGIVLQTCDLHMTTFT